MVDQKRTKLYPQNDAIRVFNGLGFFVSSSFKGRVS